jgi:hypothetical protein
MSGAARLANTTMSCAVVVVVAYVAAAHIGLKRHIIAKRPAQPPDNIMVPAELWDDTRCRELVGADFDKIRHGPYKADLCRLYVLYRHGGVYTDDDIYLLRAPTLKQLTVVRESPIFKGPEDTVGLFNAYIEVPRRNDPHILRAITMSKQNLVTTLNLSTRTLWGPDVLYRALEPAAKTMHQELCTPRSVCTCKVPGLLYSHRPCRY